LILNDSALSDAENERLRGVQVINGAAYQCGERPSPRGHVVEIDDKTPVAGTFPTSHR
jgi:hypothetical protein